MHQNLCSLAASLNLRHPLSESNSLYKESSSLKVLLALAFPLADAEEMESGHSNRGSRTDTS